MIAAKAKGQPTAALHWRTALALFGLLAGIYLLTSGGHTYSIDEELMFGVTENLVLHGSFAVNAADSEEAPIYSTYGPGQSLVAVPFYVLGWLLALAFPDGAYAWITRALVGWLNPFVTAATAALLYLVVVWLGYSRRVALGTALLYGLATMAWHYSKTFFAEPLTALLLFAGFAVSLAATRQAEFTDPLRHARMVLALLALAGLLAGLAPTVKIQAGIVLPLLGLYVALVVLRIYFVHTHTIRFVRPASRQQRLRQSAARVAATRLLAWVGGVLVALVLLVLAQWLLYGSPANSGYSGIGDVIGYILSRNPLEGIYRQVFSSGKGILWFVPPLLLWPFGVWLLWRHNRDVALLCVLMALGHIVFYAYWIAWHNADAWGPRFLVMALPFFVLPLAAFLSTLRGWRTPLRTAALTLTLLLTIPVQVGGVAINYTAYRSLPGERSSYRFSDSALVAHLSLAAQQVRQVYDTNIAPGSVGLVRGFAYSEGQRDQGQQVPRWMLPRATISLRPPDGEYMLLHMQLGGCLPEGLPPAQVALRLDGEPLLIDTPCPPQTYRMLLPTRRATLTLSSTAWNPPNVGIEREDGPLGVRLQDLQVVVDDGQVLPIRGALVPVAPMPSGAGPVTIREWVSDYRYGHWDFWWWYLAHSGFPIVPSMLLAALWFALALGMVAWGSYRLWAPGRV
jgi:hypothetical protein